MMTDELTPSLRAIIGKRIQQICVIGTGAAGSQIALLAALNNFKVTLTDTNPALLEKSVDNNRHLLCNLVRQGTLTAIQASAALAQLQLAPDFEAAAATADFVIETVEENFALKRALFARLNTICPPHTILASNSVNFAIADLLPGTARQEKACNMHFFHPALVMQLIEVVRGANTSDATVELACWLGNQFEKEVLLMPKAVFSFIASIEEPLHEFDTQGPVRQSLTGELFGATKSYSRVGLPVMKGK